MRALGKGGESSCLFKGKITALVDFIFVNCLRRLNLPSIAYYIGNILLPSIHYLCTKCELLTFPHSSLPHPFFLDFVHLSLPFTTFTISSSLSCLFCTSSCVSVSAIFNQGANAIKISHPETPLTLGYPAHLHLHREFIPPFPLCPHHHFTSFLPFVFWATLWSFSLVLCLSSLSPLPSLFFVSQQKNPLHHVSPSKNHLLLCW